MYSWELRIVQVLNVILFINKMAINTSINISGLIKERITNKSISINNEHLRQNNFFLPN